MPMCIKFLMLMCLFLMATSCSDNNRVDSVADRNTNLLHDISPFSGDSLVRVVIEAPAGTNQKWEVNKITGKLEWERISPDSLRVIDYLPYPANYGFIPQTLVSAANGGDGDPADVFVLGAAKDRGTITDVRIIGIIDMLDNGETDAKLLGVNTLDPDFDVDTFDSLLSQYPGVLEIIRLWLMHYKGTTSRVVINGVGDEKAAMEFIKTAHLNYKKELAGGSTPGHE